MKSVFVLWPTAIPISDNFDRTSSHGCRDVGGHPMTLIPANQHFEIAKQSRTQFDAVLWVFIRGGFEGLCQVLANISKPPRMYLSTPNPKTSAQVVPDWGRETLQFWFVWGEMLQLTEPKQCDGFKINILTGRWRQNTSDPEFCIILCKSSRSQVPLEK